MDFRKKIGVVVDAGHGGDDPGAISGSLKEKDLTLFQCLGEASRAAKEGADYTRTISASKGRASYLGIRSIGHQDPGATSSLIMVRELYNFFQR